mmetsp:Transcript_30613/g.40113  ORF Transcript_30613/g.40113 Transcript_30613/m.40113 type:complete len:287 (+) Transcript_30613:143-1003(+)
MFLEVEKGSFQEWRRQLEVSNKKVRVRCEKNVNVKPRRKRPKKKLVKRPKKKKLRLPRLPQLRRIPKNKPRKSIKRCDKLKTSRVKIQVPSMRIKRKRLPPKLSYVNNLPSSLCRKKKKNFVGVSKEVWFYVELGLYRNHNFQTFQRIIIILSAWSLLNTIQQCTKTTFFRSFDSSLSFTLIPFVFIKETTVRSFVLSHIGSQIFIHIRFFLIPICQIILTIFSCFFCLFHGNLSTAFGRLKFFDSFVVSPLFCIPNQVLASNGFINEREKEFIKGVLRTHHFGFS